jgi:RNase P subunit RPR2
MANKFDFQSQNCLYNFTIRHENRHTYYRCGLCNKFMSNMKMRFVDDGHPEWKQIYCPNCNKGLRNDENISISTKN